MDTLSSSVSTLKINTSTLLQLHPKSAQELFFKTHLISSTNKLPKQVSNKSTTTTTTTFTAHRTSNIPPFINSSQLATTTPHVPLKQTLKSPQATGYAVALLDMARCNNVLGQVERDVKRLSKWLRNEELSRLIKLDKGQVVLKEILNKGKFHKYLVKLVKLLVEKSYKVEIVSEVLMEFQRFFDELSGKSATQMVLVPSGLKKMEKNEVLEIANRVQKATGAVKVKVRQIVDDNERLLPSSFAM